MGGPATARLDYYIKPFGINGKSNNHDRTVAGVRKEKPCGIDERTTCTWLCVCVFVT